MDIANLFTNKKLLKCIAVIYKGLRNVTSKLYRTAKSIGFIKKALYHVIIPTFAQVNDNFINKSEKNRALFPFKWTYLESLVSKHYVLKEKLKQVTG